MNLGQEGVGLYPLWVYLNEDVTWESPPKVIIEESGARYQLSVGARILVFFANGRFASIACTIYRYPDGTLQFVPGEGFTCFEGIWAPDGQDAIFTMSRLTFDGSDEVLGQEKSEQLLIRRAADDGPASKLDLKGRIFIPSTLVRGLADVLPGSRVGVQP